MRRLFLLTDIREDTFKKAFAAVLYAGDLIRRQIIYMYTADAYRGIALLLRDCLGKKAGNGFVFMTRTVKHRRGSSCRPP